MCLANLCILGNCVPCRFRFGLVKYLFIFMETFYSLLVCSHVISPDSLWHNFYFWYSVLLQIFLLYFKLFSATFYDLTKLRLKIKCRMTDASPHCIVVETSFDFSITPAGNFEWLLHYSWGNFICTSMISSFLSFSYLISIFPQSKNRNNNFLLEANC